MAFSVRQTKPATVDDAVRCTLEMESFLKPPPVAVVSPVSEESESAETVATTNTAVSTSKDDPMKQILEWMAQIEVELKGAQQPRASEGYRGANRGQWRGRSSLSNVSTCWNCGGEGHMSRECSSPRKPRRQQGNDKPPAL